MIRAIELTCSSMTSLGVGKTRGRAVVVVLAHFGLRLPSRSKTVQNVVEKNG